MEHLKRILKAIPKATVEEYDYQQRKERFAHLQDLPKPVSFKKIPVDHYHEIGQAYRKHSAGYVAGKFNISFKSVFNIARILGIVKNPNYTAGKARKESNGG